MYRTGASQDGRESENQGGNTMSTNPQDGSRPPVVLVHGAWADGSGWQGVYDQLKDTYSVRIVQEPNLSLEGDVEATKMVIGQQSKPVILVGHSYGGVVVTEAGNHPTVAALVYIAAFVPDQGETEETLIGTFPPGVPNAGDAILRLRMASCYSTGKSFTTRSLLT